MTPTLFSLLVLSSIASAAQLERRQDNPTNGNGNGVGNDPGGYNGHNNGQGNGHNNGNNNGNNNGHHNGRFTRSEGTVSIPVPDEVVSMIEAADLQLGTVSALGDIAPISIGPPIAPKPDFLNPDSQSAHVQGDIQVLGDTPESAVKPESEPVKPESEVSEPMSESLKSESESENTQSQSAEPVSQSQLVIVPPPAPAPAPATYAPVPPILEAPSSDKPAAQQTAAVSVPTSAPKVIPTAPHAPALKTEPATDPTTSGKGVFQANGAAGVGSHWTKLSVVALVLLF
ncbi:hypothetical protein CJU90_1112 [Yarrowia sp. C11]|nr:hypothetical protein CKK34_2526 [Yarrowia sp. E02]KAG5373414.1 hypothetical protein CJU90_1112 [Yarrowia sp. C11]